MLSKRYRRNLRSRGASFPQQHDLSGAAQIWAAWPEFKYLNVGKVAA